MTTARNDILVVERTTPGTFITGKIIVDKIVWSSPTTQGHDLKISDDNQTFFEDVAFNVGAGSRESLPMAFGGIADNLKVDTIDSGKVILYYHLPLV
jgi:hypothetical protein